MKPVWSEMSFEAISFAKINFIWKAKKNNVKVKLILQEKYYSWQNISYEIQGKIMYKKRFHLKILSSGKLNNQIREARPSRKKTINYIKIAKQMLISCEITPTWLQQQKHDSHMNPKIFDANLNHERINFIWKTKEKNWHAKIISPETYFMHQHFMWNVRQDFLWKMRSYEKSFTWHFFWLLDVVFCGGWL